jgi:hypothetical protein
VRVSRNTGDTLDAAIRDIINGIMGVFDYRRKKVKQSRHAWQHIDFLGRFEFQKQQNQ